MKFKDYIEQYKLGKVQLTKKVSYNLSDVIEDDYLAINAMYEVPKFSDNKDKEYFDISRAMSVRLKASTDIDAKNTGIIAENQAAIPLAGLLRGGFRYHLRTRDYDSKFNEAKDELIDHGHVILKKVGDNTEIVDLRNVIRPPHIMDIQKGGMAERTFLTWDQMLENKKEWKKQWSVITALHEKMMKEGKSLFTVYEHWTMDDFDGKFTKGCIKYLDRNLLEPDEHDDDWEPFVELDRFASPEKEKIRSEKRLKKLRASGYIGKNEDEEPIYPYEEERFITLKGRWKGAGVYEVCKPIQKAYNRNMNDKLRFDEISHRGVSVHTKVDTKGKGLTQSALSALEYGGVVGLKQGETLERLQFGSLIGDFIASADKFFELARLVLGITAQGTGEQQPANQPATTAAINQEVSKTTYDVIIEKESLLWQRYFAKFEISSILEDLTMEEWTKLEGDAIDLEEMEAPFVENLINQSIPQAVQAGQFVPESSSIDPMEYERIKQSVQVERKKQGNMRFAQLAKDILKDAEFLVEFTVNNQSFDKINKIKYLQSLRVEALQNPNSSLSPEKLEEAILDLMDLSAKQFKRTEQEKQAMLAAMAATMPAAQPVTQTNGSVQ